MTARKQHYFYRVTGHGFDDQFIATSNGNAVRKFRHRHNNGSKDQCLTLTTDRETGGWNGVSVECSGKARI